jgi:hypothetical protein
MAGNAAFKNIGSKKKLIFNKLKNFERLRCKKIICTNFNDLIKYL